MVNKNVFMFMNIINLKRPQKNQKIDFKIFFGFINLACMKLIGNVFIII